MTFWHFARRGDGRPAMTPTPTRRGNQFRPLEDKAIGSTDATHRLNLPTTEPIASGLRHPGNGRPAMTPEHPNRRGNQFCSTEDEAIGSTHATHCLNLPATEPIASAPRGPAATGGRR